MRSSTSPHDGGTVLAVRPSPADDELNEFFDAECPGHKPSSFARVLAHSLGLVAVLRR